MAIVMKVSASKFPQSCQEGGYKSNQTNKHNKVPNRWVQVKSHNKTHNLKTNCSNQLGEIHMKIESTINHATESHSSTE